MTKSRFLNVDSVLKASFKVIIVSLGVAVFAFLTLSCQVKSQRSEMSDSSAEQNKEKPLVEDSYRLKEDRQKFDEIRKDIPPERAQENDEKAFIAGLTSDITRHPEAVREKFSSIVRKKRELFNKDLEKSRNEFTKQERKDREAFNKNSELQRKEFTKDKHTNDERKDFFGDIDQKRKDFYTEQREKRDDFEANIREKRKNFEDYMREQNNDFNYEHRIYTKKHDAYMKDLESKKNEDPSY